MNTILIIDDDAAIGDMTEELLTKNGYKVLRAYSGTEALLILGGTSPDLILLDLMLPGLSGEELLLKISGIPVIVVSAKLDVENKVTTLLSGAADYVTKPFDTSELLARINVQLRDSRIRSGVLHFCGITLDTRDFSVTANGKSVKLTKTEYAVLLSLMRRGDKVVTKENIMREVEYLTPDCEENSLRTHIGNLRAKLRAADGSDHIEAVWGIGYKLK